MGNRGFYKAKTALRYAMPFICCAELDSALDLAGTEASGTSVHMARSTVDHSLDALDIGLPGTVGASVGVADLDAEGNALVAELTLCHELKHLLACV